MTGGEATTLVARRSAEHRSRPATDGRCPSGELFGGCLASPTRIGTVENVASRHQEDRRPSDALSLRLPDPGELVRCVTWAAQGSVTADVRATGDRILVEYWTLDAVTGRRSVYIVRQYSRHDPALRAELSRLRPAS